MAKSVKRSQPPLWQQYPNPDQPFNAVVRHYSQQTDVEWHQHSWLQAYWVHSGVVHVFLQTHLQLAAPGQLLLLAPHTQHGAYFPKHTRLIALNWRPNIATDINGAILTTCPAFLAALLQQAADNRPSTHLYQSALQTLLATELQLVCTSIPVAAEPPIPLPQHKMLRRLLIRYIQGPKPAETLAQLCRHVGSSESTVQRLFQQQLGMSFRQWKQAYHAEKAKRLLSSGASMTDIAEALGMADASSVYKMLKRLQPIKEPSTPS